MQAVCLLTQYHWIQPGQLQSTANTKSEAVSTMLAQKPPLLLTTQTQGGLGASLLSPVAPTIQMEDVPS